MQKLLAVFLFVAVASATAQVVYSGLGYTGLGYTGLGYTGLGYTYPSASVYNYPTVGRVGSYYGVPSYGYAYPGYSNVAYYLKK